MPSGSGQSFASIATFIFNLLYIYYDGNLYLLFVITFFFSYFIFFFLVKENGAFMVILHPLAGRRSGMGATRFPTRPCGGSTPLRMPTNGLLRVTGLKPRCAARSERALPTQPSPRQKKKKKFNVPTHHLFIINKIN